MHFPTYNPVTRAALRQAHANLRAGIGGGGGGGDVEPSNFFQNVPTVSTVGNEWSLAFIPDTQKIAKFNGNAYNSLAEHIKTQGYTFILHCGDVAETPNATEWERVDTALSRFDGVTPYLIGIGNHDFEGGGQGSDLSRDASGFNGIFTVAKYEAHSWFYGNYPSDETVNTAGGLVIDGTKYLFLNIEVHPRQAALTWAQGVITATSPDRIIISTHHFIDENGDRADYDSDASPDEMGYCDWSQVSDCNTAVEMWDELITNNDNIILIIGGHVGNANGTPRARKLVTNVNDNPVNQHLFNPQNNSGSSYQAAAYYRIYTFNESTNTGSVVTYNPLLDNYLTDAENQFNFSFN